MLQQIYDDELSDEAESGHSFADIQCISGLFQLFLFDSCRMMDIK